MGDAAQPRLPGIREPERLYHQAATRIGDVARRAGQLAPRQVRYAGVDKVQRGDVFFRERVPGLAGPEAQQRPKVADQSERNSNTCCNGLPLAV